MGPLALELYLGHAPDSEAIQELLAAAELPNARIRPNSGDETAYVDSKDHGIALGFDSAESPILSAIFMYGERVAGHKQYAGRLPRGLEFSQSRAQVRTRLGFPDMVNDFMPIDRWNFDGHQIAIDFREFGERIETVTLQLPMA